MPTVSRGLFRWLFQSGCHLEDFADRLNHVWTCGLLLILGAIISWKHNYGVPISCWTPPQFTTGFTLYTMHTCWHRDTYYLPMDDTIPKDVATIDHGTKSYYQWLPLVLCLQALLFKLPNIFMYILHGYSGVDFHKVAGLTAGYQYLNLSERQNLANQIARYICRWCKMFPSGLPWRLLTVIWLLVKLMYCINVIIQMVYLDRFLRTTDPPYDNSTSYGDTIYHNIVGNGTWKISPAFPRTILCDFSIRQLQSVQRWTVQCELNANPFTERVYMFLWVWLLFVAVATLLSFKVWVLLTLLPISRQRYIRRFMELDDSCEHTINQDVSYVTGIVGEDGVMVLKLIAANSSELLVKDVVCGISRIVRRGGGAMLTSGTIIEPASATQPLIQPTAPREMYPMLHKTE